MRGGRLGRRMGNKVNNGGKECYESWVRMRYAGLTDEPERRKREHVNPRDFKVMQQFTSDVSESGPSVSRRNEARGSTLRSDNGKGE